MSRRAYQPRRAAESPLYRVVLDHLESLLTQRDQGPDPAPSSCAADSLRAFLECGIPRFGVVRYLCRQCGNNLFVPYRCKRRLACPSCDSKRAIQESGRAMSELFPRAPYRQWVLTVPKRLRYFVHRNPALSGELSRILGGTLARFYQSRAQAGRDSAPGQFHAIQRFGSKVNLHVHVHAVVSDGVFALQGGTLRFHPAPAPTAEELSELSRQLRQRILRRMLRLKAVPEESAAEMLARTHGGFSIDGSVRVEADDRAALERLLRYVLRPAISVKRLSYQPEKELVRYWPKKGRPEDPPVFEWTPVEFLARFSRLIPPARRHLVRYHGALAPRSPLRSAVTRAAREGISCEEILEGALAAGIRAVLAAGERAIAKAVSAAAQSWAACLRRVFEIDPLLCPSCQALMVPIAIITQDAELVRLLAHLGLPTEFPKTKPARSPPLPYGGEDSQIDPAVDACDGAEQPPADE